MKNTVPSLVERSSGILLHLTSLPGPHGVGDLGPVARRFAEYLASAGQSYWQMLPIGTPGYGNCPYMAVSAFAGSPDLISLEDLQQEGLLGANDLRDAPPIDTRRVDFEAARSYREPRLRRAAETFFQRGLPEDLARFDAFCADHATWLEDFALYRALRRERGETPWTAWPEEIRAREPNALAATRDRLIGEIRYRKFLQYVFSKQWAKLRDHCRVHGIGLIGDVPIYVAQESADVWGNSGLFRLSPDGTPAFVAGVPPDYFSPTGQRWGHPLFDWDRMRESGYAWWIRRLERAFGLFDAVRLDHFIGFRRYWEIPAACETAVNGRWVEGPAEDFFETVRRELGPVPIIAEDLGVVTPEVTTLRDRYGFPGMRVLQFGFGGDPRTNVHLPHRHVPACVVYTGTHDNDTIVGWYRDLCLRVTRGEAAAIGEKRQLLRYLGGPGTEIHWDLIRLALSSVANLSVVPMQDLLGLDGESRMNRPAYATGNWEWRLRPEEVDRDVAARLREMTEAFGRLPAAEAT